MHPVDPRRPPRVSMASLNVHVLRDMKARLRHSLLRRMFELTDNSLDAKATECCIDVLDAPVGVHTKAGYVGRRIRLSDNGAPMSIAGVHHLASFGYTHRDGLAHIGRNGGGFQTGTIGVGNSVLAGSVSDTELSIVLLSLNFIKQVGDDVIYLPQATWKRKDVSDGWSLVTAPGQEDCLAILLEHSPYTTEVTLQNAVLGGLPFGTSAGTVVEIFHLDPFDFNTDEDDIRLPTVGADGDISLRALLQGLYIDPGMRIVLRGEVVAPKLARDGLQHPKTYNYTTEGEIPGKRVAVTMGLEFDGKELSPRRQIDIFVLGRLMCTVQVGALHPSHPMYYACLGLCGVVTIEDGYLTVEPTKQGFEQNNQWKKLMDRLIDRVNAYHEDCINKGLLLLENMRVMLSDQEAAQRAELMDREAAAARMRAIENDGRCSVQCGQCSRHRFVTDEYHNSLVDDAPWTCSMNPVSEYNQGGMYSSCDVRQEPPCSENDPGRNSVFDRQMADLSALGWKRMYKERADGRRKDLKLINPAGVVFYSYPTARASLGPAMAPRARHTRANTAAAAAAAAAAAPKVPARGCLGKRSDHTTLLTPAVKKRRESAAATKEAAAAKERDLLARSVALKLKEDEARRAERQRERDQAREDEMHRKQLADKAAQRAADVKARAAEKNALRAAAEAAAAANDVAGSGGDDSPTPMLTPKRMPGPPPPLQALAWDDGVMYTRGLVFGGLAETGVPLRRRFERNDMLTIVMARALPGGGAGLFATVDMPRGAWPFDFAGHVKRRPLPAEFRSYQVRLPNGFGEENLATVVVADATKCGNEARYIRDARDAGRPANCQFKVRTRDGPNGGPQLLVMAVIVLSDVKAGHELLATYDKLGWN